MQVKRDARRNMRAVKDGCVIVSLTRIMRKEYVHGGKERLMNSILRPTLIYGYTWIWNRTQQSKVSCENELCESRMWHDKMGG